MEQPTQKPHWITQEVFSQVIDFTLGADQLGTRMTRISQLKHAKEAIVYSLMNNARRTGAGVEVVTAYLKDVVEPAYRRQAEAILNKEE